MRLLIPLLLISAPAVASAQPCVQDDELTRAASDLLLAGVDPTPPRVRAAARAAGSQLPVVSALLVAESPASAEGGARAEEGAPADRRRRRRAFLARLRQRGHAPVRCGEASSEGRALLLAGPAAGELWVEDDGHVRVDLAPGWTEPVLYARDAAGRTWAEPLRGARARLPRDLDRPLSLQLVARGPDGPRPVAESIPSAPLPRFEAGSSVAARLAALRSRQLRPNRLLRRVADVHAARICAAGRVSHVGERGDPRERLAREGIRARHVGETASRAADPQSAFDAMLASPSHRAALEDRRFTDVGVGRARDARGRTCLVVLLAAWPRPVPYR